MDFIRIRITTWSTHKLKRIQLKKIQEGGTRVVMTVTRIISQKDI